MSHLSLSLSLSLSQRVCVFTVQIALWLWQWHIMEHPLLSSPPFSLFSANQDDAGEGQNGRITLRSARARGCMKESGPGWGWYPPAGNSEVRKHRTQISRYTTAATDSALVVHYSVYSSFPATKLFLALYKSFSSSLFSFLLFFFLLSFFPFFVRSLSPSFSISIFGRN